MHFYERVTGGELLMPGGTDAAATKFLCWSQNVDFHFGEMNTEICYRLVIRVRISSETGSSRMKVWGKWARTSSRGRRSHISRRGEYGCTKGGGESESWGSESSKS